MIQRRKTLYEGHASVEYPEHLDLLVVVEMHRPFER